MTFDPTNPLHLGMRELLAIQLALPAKWLDAPSVSRRIFRAWAQQIMSGDLAGAYGEGED